MSCKKIEFLNRWTILIVAVIALLAFPPLIYANPQELQYIRDSIKIKGAKWHADETSVSGLSLNEKKMRLGLRDDETLSAEYLSSSEMAPIPEVTSAPATLDWRNVDGVSYVSPVKNQGSCGSCWAFATTAGLESQFMLDNAGSPIDLSEQILVSCSGAGTCSGGSSATASSYLRDVGLPLESCFKYTATNNLCSNACADWRLNTHKIVGWHRPSTTAVSELKNALYAYGPVVTTMYVYNDFYYYRSGVYSYTSGSYVGAHAVLTVGYDDVRQAFIVKNSWGSGWGEAGYFMIAYSEVGGTSRFAYSAMVYDGYNDNNGGTCVKANPTAVISPSALQTVTPGTTIAYTVSVTNNDSSACGGSTFNLSTSMPNGWTSSLVSSALTINPQSSASTTLLVTSPITAASGSYTVTVKATDIVASTYMASTSAYVSIQAPDIISPVVSMVSPADGSKIGKKVNIQAKASDNVGVTKMELYIDGVLTLVTTSSAITWSWNTIKTSTGPHTISVKAYDGAGNAGESSIVVYK